MNAEYNAILNFVEALDQLLSDPEPFTLYLIGGAAITLAYDHENRTSDLDFIDAPSILEKLGGKESRLALQHHVYVSCLDEINFSAPKDWRERSAPISFKKPLQHIEIRVPCIEDLCLGKLARMEPKDIEDIETLFHQGKLLPEKLLQRLNEYTLALREIDYRNNTTLLFTIIFKKPIRFRKGRVVFA